MTLKRPTIIHCFTSKLDVVIEDYENEHGPGSFVGSKLWHATLAQGWHDGVCVLSADHLSEHVFSDVEVDEKKAS